VKKNTKQLLKSLPASHIHHYLKIKLLKLKPKKMFNRKNLFLSDLSLQGPIKLLDLEEMEFLLSQIIFKLMDGKILMEHLKTPKMVVTLAMEIIFPIIWLLTIKLMESNLRILLK